MRGGRRQGAGRKKGFAAKNAEEARTVLSELVIREIRPIGEALITRAKKGDISAARELFDRAWGKPRQSMNISTEDKNGRVSVESPEIAELGRKYQDAVREVLSRP